MNWRLGRVYFLAFLNPHGTTGPSSHVRVYSHLLWNCQLGKRGEVFMPDDASATGEPAELTERVRLALESGDLGAIRDLLGPDARWGAPEGPYDADCQNRDQVLAWWASARAAGARAAVTEVTAGAGTLLVGLEVTGTPAARQAGRAAQRWQVLTVRGDRIIDIRGFDTRAAAAGHAGMPS